MRTDHEVEEIIKEYASHYNSDQLAFELLYQDSFTRITIYCEIDKNKQVIDRTGELRLFLKSENISICKNWDDDFDDDDF